MVDQAKKDSKENKESKEKDFRRYFEYETNNGLKRFYLEPPTSDQIRQAEWHYSKVYNKALVEGVATSSEMIDILTNRGIYGPDYEEKVKQLQVDIALAVAYMQDTEDAEEKEKAAVEVQKLRDQLYRWNQKITGPLSNSCEQMAEDSKTEFLTSVVIKDEDGNQVWDSYEDFIDEKDQAFAIRSRYEVLLWLQGLEPDFLDKTPENKVLKKLRDDRIAASGPAQLESAEEESSTANEDSKPKSNKGRKKSTSKGSNTRKRKTRKTVNKQQ